MVLPNDVINSFKILLGDRCVNAINELELHGKDYSYHLAANPDLILYPLNVAEVSQIVSLCNKHSIAVIPYGSGTSLEGHTSAIGGGVCIDMKRMNRILSIHEHDHDVIVEPGMSFVKLNQALKQHKLFFPLDAGPDASIGGMVNTNASGTKAVKYGTMRQNVLGLVVVLPSGEIIKTGSRARKSSAGYDLTRLFVGSEGTLGIVVAVTLRLYRLPEYIASVLVSFPTIKDASEVSREIMQNDISLGMVELLDDLMMKAINMKFKLSHAEKPTLYLEFSGASHKQLEFQESCVRSIAKKYGAGTFHFATTEQEREELFKVRKAALIASNALRPDAEILTTDVCVPISRLTECIVETQQDLAKSHLKAPLVGHVGDGNFHLFILLDPKNKQDKDEAKRLTENLIHRALRMDGTCTGEHGVGIGKRSYLADELGKEAVQFMGLIKRAVDPNNIMNPGKIFADEFNPYKHALYPPIIQNANFQVNITHNTPSKFSLQIIPNL